MDELQEFREQFYKCSVRRADALVEITEIMEEDKSQYYSKAVDWLRKAKAAYLAGGRGDEWRMYLSKLITRHQRKYKLRPMLEDLAK